MNVKLLLSFIIVFHGSLSSAPIFKGVGKCVSHGAITRLLVAQKHDTFKTSKRFLTGAEVPLIVMTSGGAAAVAPVVVPVVAVVATAAVAHNVCTKGVDATAESMHKSVEAAADKVSETIDKILGEQPPQHHHHCHHHHHNNSSNNDPKPPVDQAPSIEEKKRDKKPDDKKADDPKSEKGDKKPNDTGDEKDPNATYLPTPKSDPEDFVKLKGDQGTKDEDGNFWKRDHKHKENGRNSRPAPHWDVSDRKGNKIMEVAEDGKVIWPDGNKNKNKRPK